MLTQVYRSPMRRTVAIFILCLPALWMRAQQLPSFELPDALTRVLRDYEQAWRAGDEVALAALFTEDGFVLQNGKPPVRGHAAIREAYKDAGGGPLFLRALAYSADGVTGYIIGAYSGTENGPDDGKFILALRLRPDGRWMIAADMDNANRPPAMNAPWYSTLPGRAGLDLPYSDAVRSGNLLFLSGTIGAPLSSHPSRQPVEGGVAAETRQALENIKANLDAHGSSLDRVVKCSVFLADIADFEKMNGVYREYFPTNKPARTTVGVAGLPMGARVEIECVAAVR